MSMNSTIKVHELEGPEQRRALPNGAVKFLKDVSKFYSLDSKLNQFYYFFFIKLIRLKII